MVPLPPRGRSLWILRASCPDGGHTCAPDPACLARAKKSRALERAFSAQLPDEVWAGLEAQMKEVPQDAQ